MSELHGNARVHTLQAIFDSVPDGAFVADRDGRIQEASATLCSLLGTTKEELVGQTFATHVLSSHVGQWRRLLDEIRVARYAQTELMLVRADETALTVAIVARAPGGGPGGETSSSPFFFVRDTRDRDDAEWQLARARAELESITRTESEVPDVIATLPQTGLEMALKTIALQAQVRSGACVVAVVLAMQPSRWIFVGNSESAASISGDATAQRLVRRVIDEGDIARGEAVRRGDDRTPLLIVPLLLKGRAEGAVVFADKRDACLRFDDDDERIARVTAARAAAALASARAYDDEAHELAWLQTVFDQMPEGVTVFNQHGEVAQQNPMASTSGALCTPDGKPLAFDDTPAARALRTGQTIACVELAQRNAVGELVPVLVSAAPVHRRDDDCARSGAIMLCREIQEMKDLERMKEEWATIICHDLRQPVGVVALTAEALERQLQHRVEQRHIDGLRRICASAARLHRMIGDLADASLIEANRLRIDARRIELGALAERAAVSASETTGHRVDVRRPDAAWVYADADRVEQVLTNLLSNAIKYGDPAAPILITVERGEGEHVGEHVVAVANRGKAIAAEEIPGLFDRFSRGRRERGGSAKGFGLGLYIARGLIEAQQGRLWVTSNADATTFSFALPRARDDAPAVGPHATG